MANKFIKKAGRKAVRTGTHIAATSATRAAKAKIAAAISAAVIAGIGSAWVVASDAADSAVQEVMSAIGIEQPADSGSTEKLTAHTWSFAEAPEYYTVRGKAKVTDIKKGRVSYAGLDKLGRTQAVTAKVTYSMVQESAGWREDMPPEADTISGWGHNTKVSVILANGKTYNGYAFNRSHLLADSLGGHAVKVNLITGTRTQNVGSNDQDKPGGMAYTETLARDYLYKHKNGWVYYRATPVYKGSELVARSVYVDIKSDDGSINKRVEVYNAMNGYKVDYKTGKVSRG